MNLPLNAAQESAAQRIFQVAWGKVSKPFDPAEGPGGQVIALLGGAGSGKTQVILQVGHLLVEAKRAAEAERRQAEEERRAAESRARQAAEALNRLMFGSGHEQRAPEQRVQPRDFDFGDDFDFEDDGVDFSEEADVPPRASWTPPARKSKAELRAQIKAAKEEAEFEAMDNFAVSFDEEELF